MADTLMIDLMGRVVLGRYTQENGLATLQRFQKGGASVVLLQDNEKTRKLIAGFKRDIVTRRQPGAQRMKGQPPVANISFSAKKYSSWNFDKLTTGDKQNMADLESAGDFAAIKTLFVDRGVVSAGCQCGAPENIKASIDWARKHKLL